MSQATEEKTQGSCSHVYALAVTELGSIPSPEDSDFSFPRPATSTLSSQTERKVLPSARRGPYLERQQTEAFDILPMARDSASNGHQDGEVGTLKHSTWERYQCHLSRARRPQCSYPLTLDCISRSLP